MTTVTAAEMKEIEKRAAEGGMPYLQMMENAGAGAAQLMIERIPGLKTAAVFCGRGNNGGDGFVAARILKNAGIGVLLVLCGDKPRTEDAKTNFYLASMLDIPMVVGQYLSKEDIAYITSAGVVIDAIYGAGFHGELPLEEELCCGVINSAKGVKAAFDLPSGVECDTGHAAAGAVKADLTLAFARLKPCHELARDLCGQVELIDIGI